jgi:hypothetical protein
LGVVLWHEERLDVLMALARYDVDGICTNAPDVLARVLGQVDATSPEARCETRDVANQEAPTAPKVSALGGV